jgi:hypothetical protein
MPGARLALALGYYRIEAYATRNERDLACGPTAHGDVRYFPISQSALISAGNTVDSISCGHTIDCPHFEKIFNPIFDETLKCLMRDAARAPKCQTGKLATTALTIARTCYTITAIAKGQWLSFDIKGLSLFERVDRNLLTRTIEFLNGRLILHLSPSLLNATRN